jgi:outer membrane protein assembly factor BamB
MTWDVFDSRAVCASIRAAAVTAWTAGALATISAGTVRADQWAQFRGPGGQGVSTERVELPTSWSETEHLAWKTPMPGFGASSPIVYGDRVYVSCYSGYGLEAKESGTLDDLRLHIVCLNLHSGQILWNQALKPVLPETEQVRDHGYAASTPTTDGERLYVFFGKTGVIALDLQGNQLWQTSVGTNLHGWGSGASPLLYNDLLIVNASVESSSLVALDKRTGERRWRAEGIESSWSSPHLVHLPTGSVELVLNVEGRVLGFDPETGEQLWSCDGIRSYVCPTAVSRDGIVYVTGGRQSQMMAIRAGGRADVTESHKLWETSAGANVCSPVIFGDHLYWLSDRNQVAYCVNRHTGEIQYEARMPGQPYASPVLADNKIYITTRNGGTLVLAAKPQFELLAHNRFDDRSTFNASPAVAGNSILIRSDCYVYCVRL